MDFGFSMTYSSNFFYFFFYSASIPSGSPAYIPHIESDGSMYVQMVSQEETLAALSDKLEEVLADESYALTEAEFGQNVCAQYTEDDAWYRATVEQVTEDGQYRVRFIDYGNTDKVAFERLAKHPEGTEPSVTPAFARKCYLSGLSTTLTEEQISQLKGFIIDQEVNVDFVAEDKVKVYVGGKDVMDLMGLKKG